MIYPSFLTKHGTAERWSACDCDECLDGLGVVHYPAPAPTFAGPQGVGDQIRDPGAVRALAFAARCVPGVLGAHAVPTGGAGVTVYVCLADCVDVAAVRRAVWEASPATLDVALKLHHEESP